MTDRLTIMIAARDAAATIERAVRSCAGETRTPLLLVDDHSSDDTVARARAASGGHLRVVSAPAPGGIPVARQAGLDHVETPYAAWLDADDAWMTGRAEALVGMLDADVDIAVDDIDLHDGHTGTWLRRLAAPAFLEGPHGPLRLFERNWLPGDTQVGFRVACVRAAGGYDPAVYGPESYDLLLRCVSAGARFGWRHEVGYRMYAYPDSVSRHQVRQRRSLAVALRKHSYESVAARYRAAGFGPRLGAWAIVSMALFSEDPGSALQWLDEASPAAADPQEILEPDGPWPLREGWRRAFTLGVALLQVGRRDGDALNACRLAEALEPTAEGANNLGVALWRVGQVTEAQHAWSLALERFPGYADAQRNTSSGLADAVTTHPLRRLPSRTDYR